MSAKQTVKGVEFEYGFAENLDIVVSYTCPNCQKKNEVNLSAHKEGDRIPCASFGFLALDINTPDFERLRGSIATAKGMFKGLKK